MLLKLTVIALFPVFLTSCNKSSSSGSDPGAGWTFTDDSATLNLTGLASPGAFLLNDGSVRLYFSGGTPVYHAADGLNFVSEAGSLPASSHDASVLSLPNGTLRMYFAESNGSTKSFKSATSSDGLNWTAEADLGISNSDPTNKAFGVPMAVKIPSGSVRLYWVDNGAGGEVIKSATSTDGTTFVQDPGNRLSGGYVDPEIVSAQDGNWIGIFPTSPSKLPQKIYLATSTDGLQWDVSSNPIISVNGANAFDPTSVRLSAGTYRVYYVATTGSSPADGFFLKSGILKHP